MRRSMPHAPWIRHVVWILACGVAFTIAGCKEEPTPPKEITRYYAYVAGPKCIGVFSIDVSTGALTAVASSGSMETNSSGIAVDKAGTRAFVTDFNKDAVAAFSIDAGTGALSAIGSPVAAGDMPEAIAVDPTGKFVYAANSNGTKVSAYTVDPTTGALSPAGTFTAGSNPSDIVVDPSGTHVYVTNSRTGSSTVTGFSIDPVSGALTKIGSGGYVVADVPLGMAIDPSGTHLYVACDSGKCIQAFGISAGTGELASIGTYPNGGIYYYAIAIDPKGAYLYLLSKPAVGIGAVIQYRIDAATGALTAVGSPINTEINPHGMAIEPTGAYLYVANNDLEVGKGSVTSYTIDAASGALTLLGSTPIANPVKVVIGTVTTTE
jgi:6-phosphogluconolactonase